MHKEYLILWDDYVFYKDGRIYSKTKERFLKGYIQHGYKTVFLKCIDGKRRKFYWHRVIWTAFNGEIPDGYEVNHIREFEKTNNALSNLNLMTPKENCNFGTRNERRVEKQSKAVVAVDEDNNVIYEFSSTAEAGRKLGLYQGSISSCCRGERRTCGGYRWYYKEYYLRMIKGVA